MSPEWRQVQRIQEQLGQWAADLKQPPEAFHCVYVVVRARLVVVEGVFLRTVLHSAMLEAVASE